MTETLRIERVIELVIDAFKNKKELSAEALRAQVSKKLDGNLREGDFRAAISQLIDSGEIQIRSDGKIVKNATAVA
jgi:hypothetical protein